MINQSYNEEFKLMAVKKLSMPGSQSLSAIAREIGVPNTTLFGWRDKYVKNIFIMKNLKKKNNEFSPEQKLIMLAETSTLSEQELGEYLRKKGIYFSDLEEWKNSFYSSQKKVGRPKKDPKVQKLEKEKKELARDLKHKNKALAEMSARVVLLKKSHLIFGEIEDEE